MLKSGDSASCMTSFNPHLSSIPVLCNVFAVPLPMCGAAPSYAMASSLSNHHIFSLTSGKNSLRYQSRHHSASRVMSMSMSLLRQGAQRTFVRRAKGCRPVRESVAESVQEAQQAFASLWRAIFRGRAHRYKKEREKGSVQEVLVHREATAAAFDW